MRQKLPQFGTSELKAVAHAREQAAALVGDFYVLAPREWARLHYEVRTLSQLAPAEISHKAFAQIFCYDCTRRVGETVLARHDLYRICLQDHCILRAVQQEAELEVLLLYVLTHELVHVVRFSQQLQRLDLAPELRPLEELSVEQTTRQILAPASDAALRRVLAGQVACAARHCAAGA
jgi:hypothetical protein